MSYELELSNYRLEKAKECLTVADENLQNRHCADSVNRSYYAIFHALRAVLALDKIDYKKHSAIIAKFRELYIKNGIFTADTSRMIGQAFEVRNSSDYDDLYVVSIEEAATQLHNARIVLDSVIAYLNGRHESIGIDTKMR
jgi:uncharacterized protein (UPF0332 family)